MNNEKEETKNKLLEINKELSELVPEIRLQVLKKRAPQYFEGEEEVEDIDQSFRNDLRKYFKSIADSLYKIEQSLYKPS